MARPARVDGDGRVTHREQSMANGQNQRQRHIAVIAGLGRPSLMNIVIYIQSISVQFGTVEMLVGRSLLLFLR